jgi:hypothetical protein
MEKLSTTIVKTIRYSSLSDLTNSFWSPSSSHHNINNCQFLKSGDKHQVSLTYDSVMREQAAF